MRTRLTIFAIVLAAAAASIGVVVLLVIMFGWLGLGIGALGTIAVLGAYRLWIQPWQHRWGATDQEVRRAMPGEDLIPDAASTTRAITIAASPEQVWPWLVQVGYSRVAGTARTGSTTTASPAPTASSPSSNSCRGAIRS